MHFMKRQNLLGLATAAAMASGSHAWVLPATPTTTRGISSRSYLQQADFISPPGQYTNRNTSYRPYQRQPHTRLFSSGNDKGFLSELGNKVKSFLPTKLFGSEEEKQKLARKEEVRDQVSGGLTEMLKDAPLGIRMMGKMVSPLLSKMASGLADTMAEQQRTTEAMMDDARGFLMGDPAVTELLGEPISLGAPFSQSSSTTSINGQTQMRVELAMPVSGSQGSGTIRMLATQDGISQMQLDAGGRRLDVSLTKTRNTRPFRSRTNRVNDDDNIIEAEVIEKDTKY
jgi:hypothetical protein